jgi:hypothetical protein
MHYNSSLGICEHNFSKILTCTCIYTRLQVHAHKEDQLITQFACNVTKEGDEVCDIMSVNTVLQQCIGKVVRLNIKFEITYTTSVVEFHNYHGTGSSDGEM